MSDNKSTAARQVRPQELAEEAVTLVRKWLQEASEHPADPAAQRLAGVLRDPNGLDFTVGFVDGVVRPEEWLISLPIICRSMRRITTFLTDNCSNKWRKNRTLLIWGEVLQS